VYVLLFAFAVAIALYALLRMLLLCLLCFFDHTRRGTMSGCWLLSPSEIEVLARHLILKNTYALSGTDISVISIERHSGPDLPLWTFVFQFAHTEITARRGPFRSAMPSGIRWAGRHGPGQFDGFGQSSLLRQNRIPEAVKSRQAGDQAADQGVPSTGTYAAERRSGAEWQQQ
jgi:hypothetical protein